MDGTTGILFWGFLIVYGIVMFILSPKTVTAGGFFNGEDRKGRDANPWMITASIFIAWIFAKSVTNAANMGQSFGIVGGVGYAVYWLCIPLTGYALYRLRRKFGATGMVSFLTEHYGVAAAFCFSAAILVRLFNEVWSNTSVVGAYYGESGSAPFIIAALLFTAITAAYCCWGGMRGSLITDIAQAILFAILLIVVLIFIVPQDGLGTMFATGSWTLEGGVDFIIGAGLQCLSYGFHDAVLTDRGFLCEEKKMLKAFTVAGILGFIAILLFSLIGVHSMLNGLAQSGVDAPVVVAQSLGIAAFFFMGRFHARFHVHRAVEAHRTRPAGHSRQDAEDQPAHHRHHLHHRIRHRGQPADDHGCVDHHGYDDFRHDDHGPGPYLPDAWSQGH